MPLAVHATWNCFWDLKKHELETFCDELGIVPLSSDLLGHLTILIETVIPDVNDDQLHGILHLRCKIEEDPLAGVADAEVLES